MTRLLPTAALALCFVSTVAALGYKSEARLWLPDLASTAHSEVRITFSHDGERMLWGTIGWSGGAGGWDIYESRRIEYSLAPR